MTNHKNMSESPEHKIDLSTLENILIASAAERVASIKLYLEIVEMDAGELMEMNSCLEESYRTFLPKLDTENLHFEYLIFFHTIKKADCKLATMIYDHMTDFVTDSFILTENESLGWEAAIGILKNKTIPRLKEEGLDKSVKILEGAIMQSEIKIAYDLDEGESEEKKE